MATTSSVHHVVIDDSDRPRAYVEKALRGDDYRLVIVDPHRQAEYLLTAPPEVLLAVVSDIQDAVLGIAEREPAA